MPDSEKTVAAPALLIDILKWPLPPLTSPELDSGDARLSRVNALVYKFEYVDAAREAAKLLSTGTYDLRLVGPYLLGAFVDGGMIAMPVIFESIAETLTTNWA